MDRIVISEDTNDSKLQSLGNTPPLQTRKSDEMDHVDKEDSNK